MAPSPEQKAIKRERINARNRALHARHRDFGAAMGAVAADIKAKHADALARVEGAEATLIKERDAKVADINRQIDELLRRRESVTKDYAQSLSAARDEIGQIYDTRMAEREAAEQELYARYPDMRASHSPAAWGDTEIGKATTAAELERCST